MTFKFLAFYLYQDKNELTVVRTGFLDRALGRASEQGRQWGSVAQGSTGALRVPAMVSWPHYGPCR